MNLFHETENKYYELLSYMLQNKEFSIGDITGYLSSNFVGEIDYEVIEALFSKKEGEEAVFSFSNGSYKPVLDKLFPVRVNQAEALALNSLTGNKYAKHFLDDITITKLKEVCGQREEIWNLNDIQVKNQYQYGDAETHESYYKALSIIAEAIRTHKEIVYDNVLLGKYSYLDKHAFPVRIEYSFINDIFRVSVYDETQDRFVKLNLSTLENIRLTKEKNINVENKYHQFLRDNTKVLELDVEPIDHVIERCFRIFSYYDRQASYDAEEKKYRLSINYLMQDENEVIRDIMSLGSYVVVVSPKSIQKEVYKRILAARNLYKN